MGLGFNQRKETTMNDTLLMSLVEGGQEEYNEEALERGLITVSANGMIAYTKKGQTILDGVGA